MQQKFNARLVDYYMDKGGHDIEYMLRKLGGEGLIKTDPTIHRYMYEMLCARSNLLTYFREVYCEEPEDD